MSESSRLPSRISLRVTLARAVIHSGELPPVTCLLAELGEEGCRGVVGFSAFEADFREGWRQVFAGQGGALEAELFLPPHLKGLRMSASLARPVQLPETGGEVELRFGELSAEQRGTLAGALLAVAAEKVREGFSRDRVRTTAMYIVGASPGRAPQLESKDAGVKPGFQDPFVGRRVGEVLIRMGLLTPGDVAASVQEAGRSKERLGRYLVRIGRLDAGDLCRALALQAGLHTVDLKNLRTTPEIKQAFQSPLFERHGLVPFEVLPREISVAAPNVLPQNVENELATELGKAVRIFIAREDQLQEIVQRLKAGLPLPGDEARLAVPPAARMPLNPMAKPGEAAAKPKAPAAPTAPGAPEAPRAPAETAPPPPAPEPRQSRPTAMRAGAQRYREFQEAMGAGNSPKATGPSGTSIAAAAKPGAGMRTDLPVEFWFCTVEGQKLEQAVYEGRIVELAEDAMRIEAPQPALDLPPQVEKLRFHVEVRIILEPFRTEARCLLTSVQPREASADRPFPLILGLSVVKITDGNRSQLRNICIRVGISQSRRQFYPT